MNYRYPHYDYPVHKGLRCKDCKHFRLGRKYLSSRSPSPICHAKVKHVAMLYDRKVKTYYAARHFDKACDMYEPITNE